MKNALCTKSHLNKHPCLLKKKFRKESIFDILLWPWHWAKVAENCDPANQLYKVTLNWNRLCALYSAENQPASSSTKTLWNKKQKQNNRKKWKDKKSEKGDGREILVFTLPWHSLLNNNRWIINTRKRRHYRK